MTTKHVDNTNLVGPETLAIILGVSRNTVLNWARTQKIPCIKIGKIYRFSLKIVSETIGYQISL